MNVIRTFVIQKVFLVSIDYFYIYAKKGQHET